jgi:hypothetical protein
MADPYEGEIMHQCQLHPVDFKSTYVVVVSGDGPNFCGHMILHAGAFYFHVAGWNDPPRYMMANGFNRYLKETGKREIRRTFVKVPNPRGSHEKLEELLATKWRWLVLPHNCASFCEDVLAAGGSKAGLYSNCPALESFR